MKSTLVDFINAHQLNHCVTIDDGICAKALADELSRADFLIIPSRIESIPVIFSDALQMGTPVIATPVGDLQQLIAEHQCGVLADDCTSESLARAIEKACSCVKEDFAAGTKKLSRRFQVSETVQQWLES